MSSFGIARKGRIAVASDTANIANGEETTLADCNITSRSNGTPHGSDSRGMNYV